MSQWGLVPAGAGLAAGFAMAMILVRIWSTIPPERHPGRLIIRAFAVMTALASGLSVAVFAGCVGRLISAIW
jgi:hypothetical protein